MGRQIDRQRARIGLRETLRNLDRLEQTLEECSNRELYATLNEIKGRKAAQTAGLLGWLQKNGAGFENNLPDNHTASSPPGQNEDAPEKLPPQLAAANSLPAQAASDGATVAVIERRDISPDLLTFTVPRPAGFNFKPGQSTSVELRGLKRRYSITSAPHESVLEFFVELVPGGRMSDRMRHLGRGDVLTVDRPKGKFLLDERFSNHLMLATVTGISPFVSIMRDHFQNRSPTQARNPHRFYLLHGASYQDEFGYRDELEGLAAAHPSVLHYAPTISRPDEARNAGWPGERGRVGSIVEKALDEFGLHSGSTLIYACGNPGMVDEVERGYRPKGFEVKTERYG